MHQAGGPDSRRETTQGAFHFFSFLRHIFSIDSLVTDRVTETALARVDSLLTGQFEDWFIRKGSHLAEGIEGDGTPW